MVSASKKQGNVLLVMHGWSRCLWRKLLTRVSAFQVIKVDVTILGVKGKLDYIKLLPYRFIPASHNSFYVFVVDVPRSYSRKSRNFLKSSTDND